MAGQPDSSEAAKKGGQPGKNPGPRSAALKAFVDTGGRFEKVKASTLFTVKSNPQLDKSAFTFTEDSEYPYFTRTVFNNGILGYVDFLDNEHLVKGNSIAVGMMGMQFFYQQHDFYAGQFTKTIFPKFDGLSPENALWFITWFNKHREKLLNGSVSQFESIFNDIEIEVPYSGSDIALDFIEERIRELEEERIRELEEERIRELEAYVKACGFDSTTLTPPEISALHRLENQTIKFKPFPIIDLFEPNNTHCILKTDVVFNSGDTPYVTASEHNNSVVSYISFNRDLIETGNSIMIGGKTMVITYQPYDFFSNDSHNLILKQKQQPQNSEDIQLFWVTALRCGLSHKYHWGDSISKAKIQSDAVMAPITDDGGIDYDTMIDIITATKKSVITSLIEYIAQERAAYRQILKSDNIRYGTNS